MILADVKIVGVKRKQFIKFCDGHMPRIGETISFGKARYKIVDVTHRFHRQELRGAFHNEKYFTDMPPLEITLEKEHAGQNNN